MKEEQTGLLRQLRIKPFKWDSKTKLPPALQELRFSSRGGFGCARKYWEEVPRGDEVEGNLS